MEANLKFTHIAPWLIAAVLGLSTAAQAGITYSESVSGDISDDRLSPTSLLLGSGSNLISGTFGPSGVPEIPDLDYVTLDVPTGFLLNEVVLTGASVGGAVSFIGVQQGTQFTVPYTTTSSATLLGWHHFGSGDIGTDILPEIAGKPGTIGFIPPLSSGPYTFWIMELDQSAPHSYAFDFKVVPVPEPSTYAMMGAGVLFLALSLRRQGRRR